MFETINYKTNVRLVIERDERVGYYLYVYPINSTICIADYLCDDLDQAFIEAEERYQVSRSSFVNKH